MLHHILYNQLMYTVFPLSHTVPKIIITSVQLGKAYWKESQYSKVTNPFHTAPLKNLNLHIKKTKSVTAGADATV